MFFNYRGTCSGFKSELLMHKTIVLQLVLVLFSTPLTCCGAAVNYFVDLEGQSLEHGHRLRAFGTITLDLSRTSSRAAIRSSKLFFQHELDAPIPLLSLPDQTSADPSEALQWEAVGDKLFINRISTLNRSIHWSSATVLGRTTNFFFEAGPPNNPHGLFLRLGAHDDTVLLKPGSGPDGPRGFFVGTRIPEPSSLTCLTGGLVCLVMRRKKTGAFKLGAKNPGKVRVRRQIWARG